MTTKMRTRFVKIPIEQIDVDPSYQRELDENRARIMSKQLEMDRIGVLVVAKRSANKYVVLDGQHRLCALHLAGKKNFSLLCQVYEGLSVLTEAALFLKLNGGRKAVGALDRYRAQLVAQVPVALEINQIVKKLNLRITTNKCKTCIAAISSVMAAHVRHKNLELTLFVLKGWTEDDPNVFDGELIKAVSVFLYTYPRANIDWLLKKLGDTSPARVINTIDRGTRKDDLNRKESAIYALRDIYNKSCRSKLPSLRQIQEEEESDEAAE